MDIYELVPSGLITENELAAAKTVKMPYWNTQDQMKYTWAPSFVVAKAYLDQIERSKGLSSDVIASTRTALANAEKASATSRRTALTTLASQLNTAASSSSDQKKVRMLAGTVSDLAK
jgi:hypothetical protein